MKGKLALALMLLYLASSSMMATCNNSLFDHELMDPWTPMPVINPFPEVVFNDLMLDAPEIAASEKGSGSVPRPTLDASAPEEESRQDAGEAPAQPAGPKTPSDESVAPRETASPEPQEAASTEPEQAGAEKPEQTIATEPEQAGAAEPEQAIAAEPEQAVGAEPREEPATEPLNAAGAESPQSLAELLIQEAHRAGWTTIQDEEGNIFVLPPGVDMPSGQ